MYSARLWAAAGREVGEGVVAGKEFAVFCGDAGGGGPDGGIERFDAGGEPVVVGLVGASVAGVEAAGEDNLFGIKFLGISLATA